MEAIQPSKENPIQAGSILVYPDGFVYDKEFFELKEIKLITFFWLEKFRQGFGFTLKPGVSLEMSILLNNSNDIIESKISTFSRHDSVKFDTFYNAYKYLAASTFKQRYDAYIEEIKKNGFFIYDHKNFYENGNVNWLGRELNLNNCNVFRNPFSLEINFEGQLEGKLIHKITVETDDDQDVFFELLKNVYRITFK